MSLPLLWKQEREKSKFMTNIVWDGDIDCTLRSINQSPQQVTIDYKNGDKSNPYFLKVDDGVWDKLKAGKFCWEI